MQNYFQGSHPCKAQAAILLKDTFLTIFKVSNDTGTSKELKKPRKQQITWFHLRGSYPTQLLSNFCCNCVEYQNCSLKFQIVCLQLKLILKPSFYLRHYNFLRAVENAV